MQTSRAHRRDLAESHMIYILSVQEYASDSGSSDS
jgi:hypothetical protein